MAQTSEKELRERLAAQLDHPPRGDWDDVLRRAEMSRRSPWWRRRAWLVLPATLVVAAGASAATGVLSLGEIVPGRGFAGGGQVKAERVVAQGTAGGVGRWRITTFDPGEGPRCLKARLLDAPRPPRDGGYCGAPKGFDAFTVGRRADATRRGAVVLFGPAPAGAQSVLLSASGGVRARARVQRTAGASIGYWLIAASPDLKAASLRWLDRAGNPRGSSLDVATRFGPGSAPATVLTGTAPVAGPWRLSVSESSRKVYRGSVYEPEGLPCLQLRLSRPPDRGALAAGSCGEFREAPGFFKGEMRVPNAVPGRVREILIYGRAPERSSRVELVNRGKRVAMAPTHRGPAGTEGRFWLMAVPARQVRGTVRWTSRSGEVGPSIRAFGP